MKTEQTLPSELTEEPPGPKPGHYWKDIPESAWQDWRWQLSHLLTRKEDFHKFMDLTPEEILAFDTPGMFRVGVTPYFASLIDPGNPDCPIRRQVVPTIAEHRVSLEEMTDSLGEDAHSPVTGLVHRYPDRVLMLVNNQCASFCRFCTRSRLVGDPHRQPGISAYQGQIDYIAANPAVRDVLLSGGDPLILPQALLESLLARLRKIPHVEVIRIGTRVPIFLPQRITPELVSTLKKYHPLWMNIHINHPREITPEVQLALSRLADAGIPLGSQTVLLAGINDCPQVIKDLVQMLVRNRVRPYYLYQCDQVPGSNHFRTSIGAGMEIVESLRGHTSGFAVPTYVIDAPQGGGKVPLSPQYMISQSPSTVVVRNYEGLITAYHQPQAYQGHNRQSCKACQAGGSSGQTGIESLLAGEKHAIVPDSWNTTHQRSVPLPANLQPDLVMASNHAAQTRVKQQRQPESSKKARGKSA